MEARKWKTQRDYLRVAVNLGDSKSEIALKRRHQLYRLAEEMKCDSVSELFQQIADRDIELSRVILTPAKEA